MKLTPITINPLRHPIQWLQWRFLARLPAPDLDRHAHPGLATHTRSIFLRHLDCGSCNGCELALNALENPFYDLPGHGIHFVASPRHADVLVMTGALTYNLQEAAMNTLAELPQPRLIAVGDCAIKGDPFKNAYGVVPIEKRPQELTDVRILQIPGCPPTPGAIMEELTKLTLD